MQTSIFTPVQGSRVSEDVALQIEAAITNGQIENGERLPSERELGALFHTSRGVIREALRALKQKGLIEVRQGARGGAFVKQVEVTQVSESLSLFLKQQRIDPESLIDFRESMDRSITVLAIARAGETEKQQLLEGTLALEAELNKPQPDMSVVGEMDRELNIRLAQMARNPVFEWVMRAMQLGLSSHDHMLYEDPVFRERTASNWRETAQEIAAGNPMKALSFIGYHYVMLRRCIAEKNNGESFLEKGFGTPNMQGQSGVNP